MIRGRTADKTAEAVTEMKLEPQNNAYLTVAVYVLICALIISLFAVAIFNLGSLGAALAGLWNILKPIAYGLFMAAIIYTPEKFFEEKLFGFLDRKPPSPSLGFAKPLGKLVWRVRSRTHRNLRFKRGCALMLTYTLMLAALTGFILIVVPQVAQSYTELSTVAPDYLRSAQRWLDKFLEGMPVGSITTGIELPGAQLPSVEELTSIHRLANPFVLTVHEAQDNRIYNIIREINAGGTDVRSFQGGEPRAFRCNAAYERCDASDTGFSRGVCYRGKKYCAWAGDLGISACRA